jgi:hypothetical protein
MTGRSKAFNYLISQCRIGQRTIDLEEKLQFVELEIEFTKRAAEAERLELPMAAGFARREGDPSSEGNR